MSVQVLILKCERAGDLKVLASNVKTEQMMTSIPGVFAAGDVRAGSTKQAASATGEGASAALAIREYLKTIGG